MHFSALKQYAQLELTFSAAVTSRQLRTMRKALLFMVGRKKLVFWVVLR